MSKIINCTQLHHYQTLIFKLGKGMHINIFKNIQNFTQFLKYLKFLNVFSSFIYHHNWFIAHWQGQKTLKIVRVPSENYRGSKKLQKNSSENFFWSIRSIFFLFPESNTTENNIVVKYYFKPLCRLILLMPYTITC